MKPLGALSPTCCHWPLLSLTEGQGDQQTFCGAHKLDDPERPYCRAHEGRACAGKTTAEGRAWKRHEALLTAHHRFRLRQGASMASSAKVVVAARATAYFAPEGDNPDARIHPEELPLNPLAAAEIGYDSTAEELAPQPSDLSGQLEGGAQVSDAIGQLPPANAMRAVAALDLGELQPQPPPTAAPLTEWMAPGDLLVDATYQRDLSDKSLKLIRKIVETWDWRRFKPPVVAWTERGFEIIDGQHTAIAAATHPAIDSIPVLVVEAPELVDRAQAFIGHNRDRLAVSAVQLHHAAVAAGDENAQTIEQVCGRAGVTVIRTVYGARPYKPGETIAIGQIATLVGRRHAKGAREVLEVLVKAGIAPISANAIKAVELLMFDPDYAGQFEPEELAKAILKLGDEAEKEARLFVGAHNLPFWKGLAATWFKKTRKRREA